MRVSWNKPEFDGGSPITGYLVEYKQVSSPEWVKCNFKEKFNKKSILVKDLHEKTEYQFRVSAKKSDWIGELQRTVCYVQNPR